MSFANVGARPIETGHNPHTPIETNLPADNDYMIYLRSSGGASDAGHSIKLAGKSEFYIRPGSLDGVGPVDVIATGAPGGSDELYYSFGDQLPDAGQVLFSVALGEPAQVTPTQVTGTVRVDGQPVQRLVRAFEYQSSEFKIEGRDLSTAKPLGEAVSDPNDGAYQIVIESGFTGDVFVVAFDDYGQPFQPDAAVAIGDRIHPTAPNGLVYDCVADGTLPGSEPAEWPEDTDADALIGSAAFRPTPYYRPRVHGPLTPEPVTE